VQQIRSSLKHTQQSCTLGVDLGADNAGGQRQGQSLAGSEAVLAQSYGSVGVRLTVHNGKEFALTAAEDKNGPTGRDDARKRGDIELMRSLKDHAFDHSGGEAGNLLASPKEYKAALYCAQLEFRRIQNESIHRLPEIQHV